MKNFGAVSKNILHGFLWSFPVQISFVGALYDMKLYENKEIYIEDVYKYVDMYTFIRKNNFRFIFWILSRVSLVSLPRLQEPLPRY